MARDVKIIEGQFYKRKGEQQENLEIEELDNSLNSGYNSESYLEKALENESQEAISDIEPDIAENSSLDFYQ